jgi:serine/threonine-protein kinase
VSEPEGDVSSAGGDPSKKPKDPLVGKTINGRFQIFARLGRGGMGKIYKALQSPLNRVVALKVLNPDYAGDRDPLFLRRFYLEASSASKLTHPNTITIFDYGYCEEEDIFFIAMEYLQGSTLAKVMRRDGPFDAERVIHISSQICKSLREAHSHGIIHRDLKPENIIVLDDREEVDFVKVLDFGLVKFFGEDHSVEDLTKTGLFMGSPRYASPEQIKNAQPDPRSDIYSAGIIMYQMLTGQVPFDDENSVAIILKHLNEAPPRPAEVRPDLHIPEMLEAVVLKTLEKQRESRYQAMDELLAGLRDVRQALFGVHSGDFSGAGSGAGSTPLSGSFPRLPAPSGAHPGLGMPPAANMSGAMDPGAASGHMPLAGSLSMSQAHTGVTPGGSGLAAYPPAPEPTRSRLPLFILLFLVLLVAGGIGLLVVQRMQQGSGAAKPMVVVQQPAAQPAQATGAGQGAAPMNPGTAPAPVAAPAQVPAAAPGQPAPAAGDAARYSFTSDPPGAKVYEGKRYLGRTPLSFQKRLTDEEAKAERAYVFRRAGYQDATRTARPVNNAVELHVKLDANPDETYKDNPYD